MNAVSGVHMGADVQAREEAPSRRAERHGKPRFHAAEARNGMPAVLPYRWRACCPESRRARLAAAILAEMEAAPVPILTRFQCSCCDPARRIYFRANWNRDDAYHEEDHTPAVAAGPHA